MQACVKVTRYVRRFLFAISAILIAVATGFAAFNAISRFFFDQTFSWSEELCTYCVVLMVYLGLPQLEGTDDQLCITAIDLWVKGNVGRRILNCVRGLITSATLAVVGWYGVDVMLKAFKRSQTTYILQIPKGVLYGIAMGCFAISILITVVVLICRKGEFDNEPG